MPRVSPPVVLGGWAEGALVTSFGVGDPAPRAGEVDFGVRANGSSTAAPKTILPPPLPKENLPTSLPWEFPAPCAPEEKLKLVELGVKENPLLLIWSVVLAGAAETSALDEGPKTKLGC